MIEHAAEKLLVTGASGHLGRIIIEELLARDAQSIIGTTRDPAKAADLRQHGVDIREADFDRPETLAQAFRDVQRLVLVSTDALHPPRLRIDQHRAAIAAAVEAGVKHIVYTSLPNSNPTREGSIADDHFWTEVALYESGLEWTILRNNLYTEGLLWFADMALKSGRLVSAIGTNGRSYVTRADCGRTAAGALLVSEGRTIRDVTGPVVLTHDEFVAELSEITGRRVKHIALSPEEFEQQLLNSGLPAGMSKALVQFDTEAAQGFHASVTPAVLDFSGRQPVSANEFLREHRAHLASFAEAAT